MLARLFRIFPCLTTNDHNRTPLIFPTILTQNPFPTIMPLPFILLSSITKRLIAMAKILTLYLPTIHCEIQYTMPMPILLITPLSILLFTIKCLFQITTCLPLIIITYCTILHKQWFPIVPSHQREPGHRFYFLQYMVHFHWFNYISRRVF